ncbi:hypothetical protein LHU53_09585 [Rhodoferax sp. U2-2l]|uniref:hypothetical protein n=1 Tax=Rhodoferax sp. U2-2l TaxID=2884000 RepID=UPI001D09E2FD|nr:hypothetical protein [Rhodoferax sp. U2-2l]MCB8747157.1 hypothetical protein [Rhodoferax sp. U2-2l]
MSHYPDPEQLLCLTCGTFLKRADAASVCIECGAPLDHEALLRLYEYAAEVYYYGHQYRVYYEIAYARDKNPAKPSLGFPGEAFAWVMLAVLSGVLGNAGYDAIKTVIAKIRTDVSSGRVRHKDYSALLELSDEQLGELIDAARTYCDGMEGLTKEVRAAIVEEIVADTVSHDPAISLEMMKLMQRKEIKPKHRKRFAELLRGAIVRSKKRTTPSPGALNGLWSRLEK